MARANIKVLKKRAKLLSLIKSVPKNKRSELLEFMSEEAIHWICECLHNLFKNTFGLNHKKCAHLRKRFGPYKNQIKTLTSPKTSLMKRKQIMSHSQTGDGIFAALASIALPAILGAITSRK